MATDGFHPGEPVYRVCGEALARYIADQLFTATEQLTMNLNGKTLFITGASRGIGLAIAKRAAKDGANIVIAAKTAEANPEAARHDLFGRGRDRRGRRQGAAAADRHPRRGQRARRGRSRRCRRFGGIDILVNNASAISLTPTPDTPMKRFDLMFGVNVRGTYLCTQACLPQLIKSAQAGRNPHVLNMSPPLSMKAHWFKNHVAYTMAKYGMSECTLGPCRRVPAARHRRQQPVAAHGDRDRGAADDPRRRPRSSAASPRSWPTRPTSS